MEEHRTLRTRLHTPGDPGKKRREHDKRHHGEKLVEEELDVFLDLREIVVGDIDKRNATDGTDLHLLKHVQTIGHHLHRTFITIERIENRKQRLVVVGIGSKHDFIDFATGHDQRNVGNGTQNTGFGNGNGKSRCFADKAVDGITQMIKAVSHTQSLRSCSDNQDTAFKQALTNLLQIALRDKQTRHISADELQSKKAEKQLIVNPEIARDIVEHKAEKDTDNTDKHREQRRKKL